MHPAILGEITDVRLAERQREAAVARRVAQARRARTANSGATSWRTRMGTALVRAGETLAGPRGVTPRQIGGAR